MENRASLKLNVGKMLRFLRHNQVIKIAFDTIAVYLSAIFEKLLLLYVQQVEKLKNQRSFNEIFQQHKSLFEVFSRFEDTNGVCVKSRRDFEGLLSVVPNQSDVSWRQKWLRNHENGLRFDENAKKSLYFFVKCPSNECNCAHKKPSFGDWMTKLMYIAEHRNSLCLNTFDVLEASRCLLNTQDLPTRPIEDMVDTIECGDWKTLDIAYLWEENEAKMPDLRNQLSLCDPSRTNAHVSFSEFEGFLWEIMEIFFKLTF